LRNMSRTMFHRCPQGELRSSDSFSAIGRVHQSKWHCPKRPEFEARLLDTWSALIPARHASEGRCKCLRRMGKPSLARRVGMGLRATERLPRCELDGPSLRRSRSGGFVFADLHFLLSFLAAVCFASFNSLGIAIRLDSSRAPAAPARRTSEIDQHSALSTQHPYCASHGQPENRRDRSDRNIPHARADDGVSSQARRGRPLDCMQSN
jgi:hypothetical protein